MDAVSIHVFSGEVSPPTNPHHFTLLAIPPAMATILLLYALHRDYRAFKALGPGGTPQTLLGYLRIKALSLFALSNPRVPANIPARLTPQAGYLRYLPPRLGPRPIVEGIAPHRQKNQRPSPIVFGLLVRSIYSLSQQYPLHLEYGTSCLEKHGPGLFTPLPPKPSPNCSTEICHSHPSDGSTHLTLHPADAALVLANGWGERHPLGRGGWLSRFVPGGFTLVYAPMTAEDVEVVKSIVEAAIWWVGGFDVKAHALAMAIAD